MRERDNEGWGPHGGGRRGHFRAGPGPRGGPGSGGPGFGPGFGRGFSAPAFGDPRMGGGPGPGWRGMRGQRARRGDVRAAALALLSENPMNGYQIIQEIGERSGGVWRPSPGSVYPALQQLEDEGLIRTEDASTGRRAYVLTDEGRQYTETHQRELDAPWDAVTGGAAGAAHEMRSLVGQLGMAARQVLSAGTDSQVTEARKILADARRALYRILAADDEEQADASTSGTRAEPGGEPQ